MNRPFNPATATAANFYITDGTNPVAGSISLLDNNHLLHFKPASPLNANSYYYVYVTGNLRDVNNLSVGGPYVNSYYYFYTNSTSNTSAPTVIAAAPTNGATAIGTNAVIGVTLSENVDGNTLDPANVTLNGPGGGISLTISYNSS